MKTQTKIILALTVIGILGLAAKAKADSAFEGWQYFDVTGNSATVFTGMGRVKAIYASSDTSFNANFAILADTYSPVGLTGFSPVAFTSTQRKSPALTFASTSTASGIIYPSIVMDYGEDGVLITSACWLYKSNAASGEALHIGVLYRK